MTMPTPTADPSGAGPAWMPDEATLARMASEFYGQLSSGAPGADSAAAAPAGTARMPTPDDRGPRTGPVLAAETAALPDALPDAVPRTVPSPARHRQFGAAAPSLPGAGDPGPASHQLLSLAPFAAGVLPAVAGPPPVPVPVAVAAGFGGMPAAAAEPAAPTFYFIREAAAGTPDAGPAGAATRFDVEAVRRDFPILAERVHGRPLVWLDNAATTQKPRLVIDRLSYFYEHENSNIHRGAHALATRATDAYEGARDTVASFLGASSGADIAFTRGTTEAINLVAQAWGRANVGPGDEIVLSQLEHHANIVPWQLLAEQTGAVLKVIPVDDVGRVMLGELPGLLSERTRLVAVSQVSNVLGTIVPVREIAAAAHAAGALVLVDGAQAVAHTPVNVQELDADFYVFSGHKVFGPTGIGALYGKPDVLAAMPPWQGGGNMIQDVTFEATRYQPPPGRFEAGTGNIADAVALGAALDYVRDLGLEAIASYEHALLEYATAGLCAVPGLRLIGTAPEKASVLTFVLDGTEPEQVGSALDQRGIAVRAGHHCAQPILRRYGLEAAVRPSLAMYNTRAEVDQLVAALHRIAADAGRHRR